MKTELWEILVPVEDNYGNEFSLSYHREWDSKVRELTGGLTIMKTAKGQWCSTSGQIFVDETIPVRVACDREILNKILAMTKVYYNQEVIFAFKVSEEVIFYS
jgi:hypothetical protein